MRSTLDMKISWDFMEWNHQLVKISLLYIYCI